MLERAVPDPLAGGEEAGCPAAQEPYPRSWPFGRRALALSALLEIASSLLMHATLTSDVVEVCGRNLTCERCAD